MAPKSTSKELLAVANEISALTMDATQRVISLRHDLESFSEDDQRALGEERKHLSRLKLKLGE